MVQLYNKDVKYTLHAMDAKAPPPIV